MKAITFSFDDGVVQDVKMIRLMQKYGLRGTFNINSGLFGSRVELGASQNNVIHQRLARSEIAEVYKDMEVAAHTRTHPHLIGLDRRTIVEEVVYDYMRLAELTGKEVIGMAYPGGPPNSDEFVRRTIAENTSLCYARRFASSYSFEAPKDFLSWKPTAHLLDARVDSLIEAFFEREGDGILFLWGHTYELDVHDAWGRAEEIFAKLSGKKDVRYLTNGEVYRAVQEEA